MRVIQRLHSGAYVFMGQAGEPVSMDRAEAEFVIDAYGYVDTMPDQRDRYARTYYLPTTGA